MEIRNESVSVRDWLLAVPNLGKLLFRLTRDPRVPRRSKIVLGAVAAYFVVPFDFIPDWIPGLGKLEDLALVVLAVDGLLSKVPEAILEEHWDGDPEVLSAIRGGMNRVTELIPERIRSRALLGG